MPAWSGLYDGVHSTPYALSGVSNAKRRLRRAFNNSKGAMKDKEVLRTLVTDDVGSAALATRNRVAAHDNNDAGSLGGVRTIETETKVNANVAAADETAMLLEIDNDHTPTFPVEASGNSGGGKLGF